MGWDKKSRRSDLLVGATLVALAIIAYFIGGLGLWPVSRPTSPLAPGPLVNGGNSQTSGDTQSVALSDTQLTSVKIATVGYHFFPVEEISVGSIDFNQDMSVQVFSPYQGRIISLFAKVGDDVKCGQPLFIIDSPDLLQAEATLIAAAGTLELKNQTLVRAKELYHTVAISQRELEQAVSEQQAAEGALKAARDAVRIFGKIDIEIDRIIANRQVDSSLLVPSPISGRITARNAAPGLFVQPGGTPAPFTVADLSTMWLIANVPETSSPQLRLGQEVRATVTAYPDRTFEGKITTIGAAVDLNTRRLMARSEIKDPQHVLQPGMFATFVIQTGEPVRSLAVPLDGVVREGDGTIIVWVTKDHRRFEKRIVQIGRRDGGYNQIIQGLQPGDLIATDGALFLSNLFAASSPG